MNVNFSDQEIKDALRACADEPAHTPGTIQPFGFLMGCEAVGGQVRYASANCEALFGQSLESLFSKSARDLLGREIWHQVTNFSSSPSFGEKRFFLGIADIGGSTFAVHLSKGGDFLVFEVEDEREMPKISAEKMREQSFLVDQIQGCDDERSLFELSTRLLRHLTGFDRVMVYRFDATWNGEVVAEARKQTVEPYLGLHFPHWDIPAQARALMAQVKLRLIACVDDPVIPIHAANDALEPLDMSAAHTRGASRIHIQYLQNMGVASTMTLSVVLDGQLWGMISFHHLSPKVASSEIRQILTNSFLPIFCLKLNLLSGRRHLELSRKMDEVQSDIQRQLESNEDISKIVADVGPTICQSLELSGLAIVSGSQTYSHGRTAPQHLVEALIERARQTDDKLMTIDRVQEAFPDLIDGLGALGGALVVAADNNRGFILYRDVIEQSISWAGTPGKTISKVDGNNRLQPRGSFSLFLESVRGQCLAWSDNDIHLAGQLWPLLSAAERQAFMNDLSRQQILMIGELNHRVRNILSLIKSVSKQARRTGGSLETYSQALEARILALAAAHDIASGTARSAVMLHKIIRIETNPFDDETRSRVEIIGPDFPLRAESAPIFTLVLHELMTNALKYGSLSVPEGRLKIEIASSDSGIELAWTETGGPPVTEPKTRGFGTTLISQAVPFEMNGEASLDFAQEGLKARFKLPARLIERRSPASLVEPAAKSSIVEMIPIRLSNGLILILEDNFMIASDLQSDLQSFGFANTEILSNVKDSLELIASEPVAIGLLDINLGSGQTSEPVATELLRKSIPFLFISGYGDQVHLPPHLRDVPILTKPLTKADLSRGLSLLAGD